MVTNSYDLLQNYKCHRRNYDAIMRRKRKEPSLPPKPERHSEMRLRYRPFLNYTSSFVSLNEYYRPTNRLSSLRIFNENINHADRLEKIRLKLPREPPTGVAKTNFPKIERERTLQGQNMEIAKRILETKSLQIDFKHFSRDFDNHRLYSKLRSKAQQLLVYSQITTPPLPQHPLEFGRGSCGLRFILEELSFRGFLAKPEDKYLLSIKVRGLKPYRTDMLTFDQLLREAITVRIRRRMAGRGLRVSVTVWQYKGTR